MILNEMRVFQDIFKELRLEKGLSQEKIAEELDVSPALISKWENNLSTPDPMMLDYIADYFNVTTDYLIRRSNMRNNPMENMQSIDQYKVLFDKDNVLTKEQKDFMLNFIKEQHEKIDNKTNKGK